ncbi:MAG: Arc family DNA-binding protein [Clostridiales bacterium]|nr:Arc family DNA-binding protein [Clostridiales bacterium]
MSIQANPYPLRVDKNVMEKTKYIAKGNGRSVNKEIEFLMRKNISEFESLHGVIELSDQLPEK